MGRRDRSSLRSDSGYGDELPELAPRCPTDHPLTLKGYEIGPAYNLHIGDVFEFIWADAVEFQWEWKCLGYTRFIVLRHSESYPGHCVCIPISTGGVSKHEFAKPGIDSFQQGFIFANGEPNPGYEQPRGGPKLQYSPVGVELRSPGRLRVREDSRANYADIIQVDRDAQVLVVGDVVKYFDRVRRNVNKAYMRQIIRMALEKYQADKVANTPRPVSIVESVDGDQGGAECRQLALEAERAETYTLNEPPTEDEGEAKVELEEVASKRSSLEHHRISYSSRAPLVPSETLSQAPEERQSKAPSRVSKQEADYDLRSMHKVAMAGLK
ncbi:hypothetical protein F4861DRAFT_540832 [Xylaria intraflava]|nr:hypothetical protein F4861DRAFT_540832 [Xylaria intraflava]